MYDFRGPDADPAMPPLAKPHVLLTAAEALRVSVEYPASWLLDAVSPRVLREVDGRSWSFPASTGPMA